MKKVLGLFIGVALVFGVAFISESSIEDTSKEVANGGKPPIGGAKLMYNVAVDSGDVVLYAKPPIGG